MAAAGAAPAGADVLEGLMQDVPLTLDLVLRRIETVGADLSVSSALPTGVAQHRWGEIAARSRRLIGVLDGLGLSPGARVATLAWNSHRHLELFYGVPCSGRILHTLNARLEPSRLVEQSERIGDSALFIDASLTRLVAEFRQRLPKIVVVMDDGVAADPRFDDALRYEELVGAAEPREQLVALHEQQALAITHTSGTTGSPKAVAYSHRSVVLHALCALSSDHHGVSRGAVVMPLTPMFHLLGWGLPYSSALAPARLVLAGADNSPEALGALIESERVTLAAGIPTFWVRLLDAIEDPGRDLSCLRRVVSGGSPAPRALAERYRAAGVEFVSSWGMTEANSGTTLRPDADLDRDAPTLRQGAAVAGVELRIVDSDGFELPWDDAAVGELEARGPWIASAYLDPDDNANETRFHDGWLRTGDLARIDAAGSIEIVDRLKDLIKSGGEWISSSELEAHLARMPGVREAVVVAAPDETWGERPLALLVAEAAIDLDDVRAILREAVPSWWVPERIEIVSALPMTSVGKIDKQRLRERYASNPSP
jgi:fatty-acyl-CoA synthase